MVISSDLMGAGFVSVSTVNSEAPDVGLKDMQ